MSPIWSEFWGVSVGALVSVLIGVFVGPVLDFVRAFRVREWRRVRESFKQDARFDFAELFGEPEARTATDWASFLLGTVERLLLFGAIWVEAYVLVVGWLAVKVASKWQSWRLADDTRERDDKRRSLYTEVGYLRFLIGTGMDVVIAMAGVGVGRMVVVSLA